MAKTEDCGKISQLRTAAMLPQDLSSSGVSSCNCSSCDNCTLCKDHDQQQQLRLRAPHEIDKENSFGIPLPQTDCASCDLQTSAVLRDAHTQTTPHGWGQRMLTVLMLHAWRQRRHEVKCLQATLENKQKEAMKCNNQLHVYSTLIRVEQKRNDELTQQLKQSMEAVKQVRTSCDSLTTTMLKLTADKALLEQELDIRSEEHKSCSQIAAQAKSDLFRALLEQRALQSSLAKEQRALHEALHANEQLAEELAKMRTMDNECRKSELNYRDELKRQQNIIKECRQQIEVLDARIEQFQVQERELESYRYKNEQTESQMSHVTEELANVKLQLEVSKERLEVQQQKKMFPFSFESLHNCASNIFYVFFLYLLPGTPPRVSYQPVHICKELFELS